MSGSAPHRPREVLLTATPPEQLLALVGESRRQQFEEMASRARSALAGRTVWQVNSTASGGGVAELLRALLPMVRGVGVDTRWLVLSGGHEFFTITKRVHNRIYGLPGDGGELGSAERAVYEHELSAAADELAAVVDSGDVVVLHDPQTAGLVTAAAAAGALVVWRCHIGCELDNDLTRSGWGFLRSDVEAADRVVFSRADFAPDWLPSSRVRVVPPSIDPFSAKNQALPEECVRSILAYTGLVAGRDSHPDRPRYLASDGGPHRVNRRADVFQAGPPAPFDRPLVVQVSRWDRAKDMPGVMRAFAELVPAAEADLLLVGPAVSGVADDPEGASVLQECESVWRGLPHAARTRIHLACLPIRDVQENAVIVNALQRHAAVVTQKSVVEGFGLTVTEAMWKGRPVVGSAVGGIADQIVDGVSGLLLHDPHDEAGFARLVMRLLGDDGLAQRIGAAAEARVRQEYLGDVHLIRWGELLLELTGEQSVLARSEGDVNTGALAAHRSAAGRKSLGPAHPVGIVGG